MLCKLGTPPSENICFPHRQDRHGPHVSAGSHSSEREPFPCPHALTPTFITPTPAAAETSSSLWAQAWTSPSPHPLPRPRVVLCQCGHFTAERTAPVLLSPHHSLSRGREGRGGGVRGREGMEGEGKEASALLPQSGDCWNADRSICHALPSHTHLLSEGLTLSIFLLCSLPLSLLAPASLAFLLSC